MKVCDCPRCSFFADVAVTLAMLGDVENANLWAAEVTITDDNGDVILPPMATLADEGYSDTWRNDPIPENVN
jgi:hypothetical protein